MTHRIDMILDLQYGSTGKGLIAGYLAKRQAYDTAICAFAPNAGHTYRDGALTVMTQQLPTAAVVSRTVKTVLLGPGSAIHVDTLLKELSRYDEQLQGKRILIHPQAAIVEDYHSASERGYGTAIGSTTKGVGEAFIERIRRNPKSNNTAGARLVTARHPLAAYLCTELEYNRALDRAESVIVEGAQGFSLSLYHGQYPYTTSRDVTPWQVAADCGLPFKWANYTAVIGTLRTYPIRVNNRDGTSGPCYPDQREITWGELGLEPEMTTVTKLPRRIFTFSEQQLTEALFHCGGYWNTRLFLNFCNYLPNVEDVPKLIELIETPKHFALNPPQVMWLGWGPDDLDVVDRMVTLDTAWKQA